MKRIGWMVTLTVGAYVAQGGDWTQWRGSNRDLIVTETGLLKAWPEGGPKQLWQIDLPGDGYSEPIVVDGILYITGNEGEKRDRTGFLYAMDAKTGKDETKRWKITYGPEWSGGDGQYPLARTTPTLVGDVLYVTSGLGGLSCISVKEKKVVWQVDTFKAYGGRNITWGIAENPLVYDGKVITQPGGADASVVALDAKTGALVWKSQGLSEKSAYCSPALITLNGKRQVVTQLENHAVGLDAETGALLWKHPHRNQHAVHPNTPLLFDGNKIFISSGYRLGSEMLEIAPGGEVKVVWKDKTDNHFQGFTLHEGRVFSSGAGKMGCFDPKDGREVYTVEGARKTSFCITPSGMITYDENGGKVMLVDITSNPDAAKVISSFTIGYGNDPHWSSPVVANGVMYLRRGKGLAAFDIAEK